MLIMCSISSRRSCFGLPCTYKISLYVSCFFHTHTSKILSHILCFIYNTIFSDVISSCKLKLERHIGLLLMLLLGSSIAGITIFTFLPGEGFSGPLNKSEMFMQILIYYKKIPRVNCIVYKMIIWKCTYFSNKWVTFFLFQVFLFVLPRALVH